MSSCTIAWSARPLLDLVPSSARIIDVGKDPDSAAGGAGRQEEIARLLVEHGRASAVVVRLKGGDPFLFGRGGEEVEALAQAGLAWEVVPGVTSAFGVPAAVGIPVTQRGVAASVTVVTGRVGAADGTSEHDWAALARVGGTLVILMGMTTRAAIAAALIKGGRAPETPVAVIASGTTASQQVRRTTLRRPGRRRARPARHHRRRSRGRARAARRPGVGRWPAGRAHRGGDPHRRAGTRPRRRARACGCDGAGAAADPPGRTGGRGRRAAGGGDRRAGERLGGADVGRRGGPLHGRAARRRAPSGRYWWPPWDRPRPTRCAGPAWSPTWCRRSTVHAGWSRSFPTRRSAGTWRVLFPSADLAPATIPDGLAARRGGTSSASRPIARWRGPRPCRRCSTGWPRPTR